MRFKSTRRLSRSSGAVLALAGAALLLGPAVARAELGKPYDAQVQLGPSLGVNDAPGQLHLGLEFGANTDEQLSLVLPFELGLGGGITRVQFEPGVEGHLRLVSGVPLYLVPRAGVGLGVLTHCCSGTGSNAALALNLGTELRYVIKENVAQASFQPLRLDVYPVGTNQSGAAPIWYAILFGLTANL